MPQAPSGEFVWMTLQMRSHPTPILGGSHIQLANFGSNVVTNENVTGVRCVRNGIREVPWMHQIIKVKFDHCNVCRVTIAPRRCQPCNRCVMKPDTGWNGGAKMTSSKWKRIIRFMSFTVLLCFTVICRVGMWNPSTGFFHCVNLAALVL